MINREVVIERIKPIADTALKVLTTAYRAPLFFMLGCGYVEINGKRRPLHDHRGQLTVKLGLVAGSEVTLGNSGGQIVEWIKEGEIVPDAPRSQGRPAEHNHSARLTYGPYEIKYT